jgi:predicted esterase
MAFRAGVRGAGRAAAIVAVGADVPPELLADASVRFPPVLLARGARDDWFTSTRFEKDVTALNERTKSLEPLEYEGAHEWNAAVSDAIALFLSRISRGH